MKTKIISFVLLMLIFMGCFSGYSIAYGSYADVSYSNEDDFIPDDENALEESERFATEASKYNFDQNPLIDRDRKSNHNVLPSFDIDETGFVRSGTILKDLKGKKLVFYTGDNFAAWSYRNAKGETIDEWKWFEQVKGEIGLSINYRVTSHTNAVIKSLIDMNAGKQCDILYSTQFSYPNILSISRSITDLISINNIGSSPCVCKRTMDLCKWGNSLRVIAPVGVVDVLWYNQTLAQQLGLSDPHIMWEYDVWDWNSYTAFQKSIPEKSADGKTLTTMVHWNYSSSYIWPLTTGTPHIYIDGDAAVPTLVNNWDADSTKRAWEFATDVYNVVNYAGPASEDSPGNQKEHNGLYEGTTLMSGTMYPQTYHNTEYSKHIKINWVPYPMEKQRTFSQMQDVIDNKYSGSAVKPAASHDGVAQSLGYGMLLPKKTIREANVDIALKFMELWATRFTESYFDNLTIFEYHRFNYLERKQYFDFVTQNVVFGLPMNNFEGTEISTNSNFFNSFSGDPTYSVKTEATKISDMVDSYIRKMLAIDTGWFYQENGWVYYENGEKITNRWIEDSVGWCYVGADGYCVTNSWQQDTIGWCYLDASGRMATNKWVRDSIGWCFVGSDGYAVTNCWKKDSVGWCYLNSEGSMTKNAWVLDGGKWYFLDSDGYMVSNTWRQDSKGWCYLGSDGAMATNKWIKDSVGWCYVGKDGYCITNSWMKDSVGWCYLDKDGRMVTNGWIRDSYGLCYLDANGYWNGIYY